MDGGCEFCGGSGPMWGIKHCVAWGRNPEGKIRCRKYAEGPSKAFEITVRRGRDGLEERKRRQKEQNPWVNFGLWHDRFDPVTFSQKVALYHDRTGEPLRPRAARRQLVPADDYHPTWKLKRYLNKHVWIEDLDR